jgi:hypothetical protein
MLLPLAADLAADVAAEVARLPGQTVEMTARGYRIVDIAGEGAPLVGVVERRGDALWLVAPGLALRLVGPLATPRIAGPGYKVWALGTVAGDTLRPRRLGVLTRP